ncbi:MAG: TolC family protein, partial [Planctomycetes bacterium]|nr:TolC family protein [Planctomycetota bacterium]
VLPPPAPPEGASEGAVGAEGASTKDGEQKSSPPEGAAGAADAGTKVGAAAPAGTAPAGTAPGAAAPGLPAGTPRVPSRILDLATALRVALANNRDYQAQKEQVYLAALALTLAQHAFAPRFLGMITGDWSRDASAQESGSVSPSFTWNMLFANGARLSINVLQNFFRFFTGDRREVAATILSGTITQPLLRGFGTEIVREPVTQAERDVAYQVRAFERFRRTFAVQVVSEYYRVLEARDRVTNAYLNWQSLVTSRDRVEDYARAGRLAQFEVDQARQQELVAQDQWSSAVERYEGAIDDFKITLGIPVESDITLEQVELEKLGAQPVQGLDVAVEDAIARALERRLDLVTARDQVEDAARRTRVAADALRAQLDVSANASLESGGGAQKPFKLNADDLAYGVGFDLDLPLDRKAERNAYVEALIAHQREQRDLSLLQDNVRLTVRDAYRRLEREVVSYGIQRASLALAEERVAMTSDLLLAGRSTTRDLLESLSALNGARNALTTALINHAVARLEFLRDSDSLRVTDGGALSALPMTKGPDDRA